LAAQSAHWPGKRAEKLAKRCEEPAQLSVRLPLLGQSPGALCLIARVAVIEHRDSSLFVIVWLRADPGLRALHGDAGPSILILRSIPGCDGHMDLLLMVVRRSGGSLGACFRQTIF
jgi:hypothetical protein